MEHGHPLAQRADARADIVVLDVGREQSQRREVAGMARHQHRRDAHAFREGEGVHRPRAAEGDQREVAGIVAALDRDLPDGGGHAGDGDGDDALGELFHRE